MKSIIISIQPKWCELIASGKKTVEVRKTAPEEVPFKAYIYETKGKQTEHCIGCDITYYGRGKVIGEFICDKIDKIQPCLEYYSYGYDIDDDTLTTTCLTRKQFIQYGKGKLLYGWHIFELKIYDKPKELSDFKRQGYMTEEEWLFALYPHTHCHYAAWAKRFEITRPPQSWQYVEDRGNNE